MYRRFLALALSALLAGVLLPASPAAARVTTRVSGLSASYATMGRSVTGKLQRYYRGSYSGYAGRTVRLYRQGADGTWKYVRSATTGSTGGFTFPSLNHSNAWKASFAGNASYAGCSWVFRTVEPKPQPALNPYLTGNPVTATGTVTVKWTAPVMPYAESYRVYVNGQLFRTLPASARSTAFTVGTSGGLVLAGDNTVEVRTANHSGEATGSVLGLRYGYTAETVARDLAEAQGYLAVLQAKWLYLDGVTVTVGETPGSYEAVAYYSRGSIVISRVHTVGIRTILNHEVWHVIDWRDNGHIDWGEAVAPKNASDYLRPAP